MLPRFARGKFSPKNQGKYVGLKSPTYRSSWEHAFMRLCDEHPNVYQWASESIKISRNPSRKIYSICSQIFYCVHGQEWQETRRNDRSKIPWTQMTMERAGKVYKEKQVVLNMAQWEVQQHMQNRGK